MRIGLFLKNLDEEYQLSIFKGIKSEAAGLGLELICVQGELLPLKPSAPMKASQFRNSTYLTDLFPSRHIIGVDGILFLSSVLLDRADLGCREKLKNLFKNIPFVSVGNSLFDYHSIRVIGEKPLWDLMDHLIVFHGYRKFLFIGGPEEHQDSIIREGIFRAAIEKYRSVYPSLSETVINGEFLEMSGMVITRNYMSSYPNDPPDVIVAANDNMAMGVQDMLLTRKDPRWSKCPVTGFDDISQSGLETPSLTTIRQPLNELGKLGLRTLWNLIRGEKVPLTTTIDASLVIRGSCGCSPQPIEETDQGGADPQRYRIIYHLRYLSVLGQSLAAINSHEEMYDPLSFFLTNLDVSLFFLIIYDQPRMNIGASGKLIYERTPGKERFQVKEAPEINIIDFIKNLGSSDASSKCWCLSHLRSSNEYLGLVIYEAQDLIHPQLYNGLILLANTVKRLFSYREDMNRAGQLEREVAYRTSDLVETNNKLREEVQRRMEVEAEVLRISEMERRRFSMDLHDDICQRLAGISMFSKSLSSREKNSKQSSALNELSSLIDETLLRTRRYAHDSFPVDLGTLGLQNSIERLCSAINKQSHCNCLYSWSAGDTSPLTQSQDINIYRIIQEALQNSVKHAKANRIVVELSRDAAWFTASVYDNGTGNPQLNSGDYHLNEKGREGLGLRSMRYRAHQAGAEYYFDSQEIGGTMVKVRIPLI